MLLYRIGHTMYADKLDGMGAKIQGGRWNHPGIPCIYSSATRALSLLEYTCHVKKHLIPRALSFVTYEAPDHSIKAFSIGSLPGNWKHWPHAREPRDFGTKFLEQNKFLLYQVPSVVIEEEMNFVINAIHPDFKRVKIVEIKDYSYDIRIKSN